MKPRYILSVLAILVLSSCTRQERNPILLSDLGIDSTERLRTVHVSHNVFMISTDRETHLVELISADDSLQQLETKKTTGVFGRCTNTRGSTYSTILLDECGQLRTVYYPKHISNGTNSYSIRIDATNPVIQKADNLLVVGMANREVNSFYDFIEKNNANAVLKLQFHGDTVVGFDQLPNFRLPTFSCEEDNHRLIWPLYASDDSSIWFAYNVSDSIYRYSMDGTHQETISLPKDLRFKKFFGDTIHDLKSYRRCEKEFDNHMLMKVIGSKLYLQTKRNTKDSSIDFAISSFDIIRKQWGKTVEMSPEYDRFVCVFQEEELITRRTDRNQLIRIPYW